MTNISSFSTHVESDRKGGEDGTGLGAILFFTAIMDVDTQNFTNEINAHTETTCTPPSSLMASSSPNNSRQKRFRESDHYENPLSRDEPSPKKRATNDDAKSLPDHKSSADVDTTSHFDFDVTQVSSPPVPPCPSPSITDSAQSDNSTLQAQVSELQGLLERLEREVRQSHCKSFNFEFSTFL